MPSTHDTLSSHHPCSECIIQKMWSANIYSDLISLQSTAAAVACLGLLCWLVRHDLLFSRFIFKHKYLFNCSFGAATKIMVVSTAKWSMQWNFED